MVRTSYEFKLRIAEDICRQQVLSVICGHHGCTVFPMERYRCSAARVSCQSFIELRGVEPSPLEPPDLVSDSRYSYLLKTCDTTFQCSQPLGQRCIVVRSFPSLTLDQLWLTPLPTWQRYLPQHHKRITIYYASSPIPGQSRPPHPTL